jgi:hypothetical protein
MSFGSVELVAGGMRCEGVYMEEMSLCGREEDFAPFAGDECDCALLGREVSIISNESLVFTRFSRQSSSSVPLPRNLLF